MMMNSRKYPGFWNRSIPSMLFIPVKGKPSMTVGALTKKDMITALIISLILMQPRRRKNEGYHTKSFSDALFILMYISAFADYQFIQNPTNIQGLTLREGWLSIYYLNNSLEKGILASDNSIDGIICRGGTAVSFYQVGALVSCTL